MSSPGGSHDVSRAPDSPQHATASPVADAPDVAPAEAPASFAAVGEFIAALSKAVRARHMYHPNNPAYERLVSGCRQVVASLWDRLPSLELAVEEAGFTWQGKTYSTGEGRDALAFLFYKDGIRTLTFLPGFEDELDDLVDVLLHARDAGGEGDDLVSLLWEREFAAFRYAYVDLGGDGPDLPISVGGTADRRITTREQLIQDIAGSPAAGASGTMGIQPGDLAGALLRDELEETLHFLDEGERRRLEAEVRAEWSRDLRRDVLAALFDRLEDPIPDRQVEIVGILTQLLPVLLSRGDVASAALLLRELEGIVARNLLAPLAAEQAARLFRQLNEPVVLGQLVGLLEAGVVPEPEDLALYFAHLEASALPLLIQAAGRIRGVETASRVWSALEVLGRRHPAKLTELLTTSDEATVFGAVNLTARIRHTDAVPALIRLLGHGSAELRRAVVAALIQMPSAPAVNALLRALDDPDRDVRIAAVRALGEIRHQPARSHIEAAILGRRVRDADLTEKIAFFETYGALAGGESVPVLDRLLNGKSWLGRRPSPELRACAALALGKIGVPAARNALNRAAAETDPVVRNAVTRALRGEGKWS